MLCPLGPQVVPWAVGRFGLACGFHAVAALQPLNFPCFPSLPFLTSDMCPQLGSSMGASCRTLGSLMVSSISAFASLIQAWL